MKISIWYDFLDVIGDILTHEDVKAMSKIPHHLGISCYEHCVYVSYIAYITARKLGLDATACARAGLLHDLYLYGKAEKRDLAARHYTEHPRRALKNALAVTELTSKERNIILSHMWPVPGHMPRSREALIVNFADKYCATMEAMGIWYKLRMRLFVRAEQLAS